MESNILKILMQAASNKPTCPHCGEPEALHLKEISNHSLLWCCRSCNHEFSR